MTKTELYIALKKTEVKRLEIFFVGIQGKINMNIFKILFKAS